MMAEERLSEHELLTAQAEQIQTSFPEFCTYLADRQRAIRLALARLPHPDDPEFWVPQAVVERVVAQIGAVTADIDTILRRIPAPESGADAVVRRDAIAGGRAR